jgi:FlaA1/EpsC-like NDP-sugar epimerase
MARHLIRLSGYLPEEQIPIAFIGLRPGEKLSEELIAGDERAEPSGVQKILRVRSLNGRSITSFLPDHIAAVQYTVDNNVTEEVIALLERLVPTFKSAELTPSVVSAPAK